MFARLYIALVRKYEMAAKTDAPHYVQENSLPNQTACARNFAFMYLVETLIGHTFFCKSKLD